MNEIFHQQIAFSKTSFLDETFFAVSYKKLVLEEVIFLSDLKMNSSYLKW